VASAPHRPGDTVNFSSDGYSKRYDALTLHRGLNTVSAPPQLPPVWLLIVLVAMGPLTMTIAIPANSAIMREFATTYGVAQLMLTVYLAAMAISQLCMGFLSDRFGRRPLIIAGLVIFILGSIIAAAAPSLEVLLFARVIQGFGGSTGQALSRATVRDVFPRDKSASVLGYISMAMIIVPMIGPTTGGILTETASWRYIFVILAGVGVIVLWLAVHHLEETAHRSVAAKPKFLPSAIRLLRERAFLGYLCNFTFATCMYYGFQAGAPYLVLEVMQRRPSEYGVYFALTAIGYFLGNFASGRFSQQIGADRMIALALVPSLVGIVLFWLFAGTLHPLALFGPMALLVFSNGMTNPNALSGALSVRPELAGTASGLNGFVQIGMAAVITFIVGFVQNGSFWPLLAMLTFCAVMAAIGARVVQTQATPVR